jgi:TM2 domain-containing membrane protein YozV
MDDLNREAQNGLQSTAPSRRKSKWAAGILSFLFPGLGHLYAGAMQRGLFFMLLFAGNIFGVVLVSMEGIVPLIVLTAVLIPVIYFYSLFDALQSADRFNMAREAEYRAGGTPTADHIRESSMKRWSFGNGQGGILLIGLGALLFMSVEQPSWFEGMIDGSGALIGAALLIIIGILIYFSGSRKNR